MEKREGYKKTKIGWIPEEWELKKFYEVVSITNGQVDPKGKPYCDMPHIGPANIDKMTGRLLGYNTAKEDRQISGKYFFDESNVLYSKIRPNLGKVVFPRFKGVCSADVYPLKTNQEYLHPPFLKYSLMGRRFYSYAVSVSMRTGLPKINRHDLESFCFALPPLPEQQKIADILTAVDDKISSIEDQLQQTRQLKKGLMKKLLTEGVGHTEFKDTKIGRIPEGWEIKKFFEVVSITNGQVDPKEKPYCDMPHIGPANIDKMTGRLLEYNTAEEDRQISGKYFFDESNVLYCKIRPNLGKVAFPRFQGVCSADVYPLKTNQKYLHPLFFKYCLMGRRFYSYAVSVSTRTGLPKINRDDLESFSFTLPPLTEQKKIAKILSTVDAMLDVLHAKKTNSEKFKKGLIQQLLTGKIRVKP